MIWNRAIYTYLHRKEDIFKGIKDFSNDFMISSIHLKIYLQIFEDIFKYFSISLIHLKMFFIHLKISAYNQNIF